MQAAAESCSSFPVLVSRRRISPCKKLTDITERVLFMASSAPRMRLCFHNILLDTHYVHDCVYNTFREVVMIETNVRLVYVLLLVLSPDISGTIRLLSFLSS